MKKVLTLIAAAAILSLSTSSCKKCGHCEGGGVVGPSYCSKDNKTIYDNYKSSCEQGGDKWVND